MATVTMQELLETRGFIGKLIIDSTGDAFGLQHDTLRIEDIEATPEGVELLGQATDGALKYGSLPNIGAVETNLVGECSPNCEVCVAFRALSRG